jgi:flagellum-specific peptidoglycan hydrolase FlgJ
MDSKVNYKLLFEVYDHIYQQVGPEQAVWATGQAALESNWFRSALGLSARNYWGIKATPSWSGAVWHGQTQEYVDSGFHTSVQGFRAYPTTKDGVHDYLSLLARRYGNPLNQPKFAVFLDSLQGKWATDPVYANKVLRASEEVRRIVKPRAKPAA